MKRITSAPQLGDAPAPQWEEYEALANRTLEFFAGHNEPVRQVLYAQLRDIRFESLEFTGWGFFVELNVRQDTPRLSVIQHLSCRAGPRAAERTPRDIGFILFIEDGRMARLEAHGFLDWPTDISGYEPAPD